MQYSIEYLSLSEIILLDKVQKNKDNELTAQDLRYLKKHNLVEGRKGNLYLSKEVAQKTNQKVRYSRATGLNKQQCKELIIKSN